jgi:NAD(P)-dependent dehydrogenase (short-subunit alcohol dehydrogenase family)
MEGDGADAGPAAAVADEIVAAGGAAVADTTDISTAEGGESLIGAALDHFGRIDVVVNNAGIMRWAGPPEVDEADITAHLAVHVMGSFHTVRAAWPKFLEQGRGRIVNTTSSGVFGLPKNTAYAAAKGGVIGLTRSLAVAGRKHDIKVNCIAPGAMTRMAGPVEETPETSPDLVAPMVAFLAHDDCPVTGEIYTAGFGRFARLFVASTQGWVGEAPTVEDVAEHWATINDETDYFVPADLLSWSAAFLSHQSPQ